jgi:hypothetical protein
MSSASTILSVITAIALLIAAATDFIGRRKTIELMARLGHHPGFERTLGIIKAVGALGLLIGLAVNAIGIIAALGLVIYFVLAIRAHARLGDSGRDSMPAAAFFILSALTLVTSVFA